MILCKMYEIQIETFYFILIKLAGATFKININLVRVPIRFQFFTQTVVHKFNFRRLALWHVRFFIPPRRISLHNPKYNIFICI